MRKLAVLAGALALAALLAVSLARRSGRVDRARPLAGLPADSIRKITIDRKSGSITLEKEGTDWIMTAPVRDRADQDAAAALAHSLPELSLGAEVASEIESYPAYELDEDHAARARVYGGDPAPLLDGWFGKAALGYDSLYFRFAKEKPVYLSSGLGAFYLGRTAAELRDRSVAGLPKDSVAKIAVKKGAKTWTPGKDDELAAALLALRFADFADSASPKDAGLEAPAFTAELDTGARSETILVGKLRPEKTGKPLYRFVRAEKRGVTGLVAAADVDAILARLQ
jgi:hypothetical protein